MALSESNDGFEEKLSRFVVGIDLGTTNCAVSYFDTTRQDSGIKNFPVEQWVDFGLAERRELLPSFWYQPLESEKESLKQPSTGDIGAIVGSLARDRGLQMPGRQIASAKSWLSHDGVDRRAAILPWQSDAEVEKLSPVQASARYLAQIRTAWDRTFPAQPLADQDVVLTLPASFDQIARQLTIEAAAEAGLHRVLPIEEPQAAFYAWLARHADDWEQQVHSGQTILVCDIGGGTTDFTLIRVRDVNQPTLSGDEEAQQEHVGRKLSLHRVAVGKHLILGGDNIDLALARAAEQKISPGGSLPPRSWDALQQACRVAKETLLGSDAPATYTIHLPGSGARLIGGGQQVDITKQEVTSAVLDGFFPTCQLDDQPLSEQVGFQEFGLPYASDPAITKHLAHFLWHHRHDGRSDEELQSLSDRAAARPDWVLFNGGVMTSPQLCERILQVTGSWFAGHDDVAEDWQPAVLDGERLEMAVSVGATYFGRVRRGEGVQIEAKLACSFYLQTSTDPPQAVCIVPGSASPGDSYQLSEMPINLTVGQPVQFPVAYSSVRLADRAGDVVELNDEQFMDLPPIRTVIETTRRGRQDVVPVRLDVELTQIGTLQMYCQSLAEDLRWKLEFDVRGSTQTDHDAGQQIGSQRGVLDEQAAAAARGALEAVFGSDGQRKPAKLVRELAEAVEMKRDQWPPSLLRSLWSDLLELSEGRRKSATHEARWLNLLGYALRPGYGMAADDWRVAQTWRHIYGKLAFSAVSSRNESLILWRRIAGGFTAGQQLTVYQQIAGPLRGALDPVRRAKGGGGVSPAELLELLRLVGSLELLPLAEKSQLGDWLVDFAYAKKWSACQSAALWAIGRLGSRVPTYGPLNNVLPSEKVESWLERLLQHPVDDSAYWLALMLCGRRVGDRYRDISQPTRDRLSKQLDATYVPPHYATLVTEGGKLATEEAAEILGEALPLGLQMR